MPNNSRIEIHQPNMNIVMADKLYPAPEDTQKVIEAQGGFYASISIRLLMRTEATARLFESISWSSKPKRQDVEKAGLLVGKYYKDTSQGLPVIWGDVVAVIPFDPNLVQATKTTITITQDAWRKMLSEYVPYKDNGYLMLGWYHTHLDDMPPRFSGLDSTTQRQYFTGEYSFAVVLNPNQKKWAVYFGPSAKECKGEMFATEEILAQYREPKITIQNVSGDSELHQNGTVVHRNPDGSSMNPVRPSPVIEESHSLLQSIGQFLEKVGGHLNRSKNSVANHQPFIIPHNVATRNTVPQQPVVSQQPPVVTQPEQVRQSAPKIAVQETAKPKITILPKEERGETRRVLTARVYVVSADNPTHHLRQTEEGLQVIEQNIIDVVDTLIRNNESTSLSLSNPINAHVELNSDLTFEIRPSEEKDNATIEISKRSFNEYFTGSIIQNQINDTARSIDKKADGTSYLLYVSSTPERIEMVAIQINKEKRA